MRRPGIEPGSQEWESCMIPLHQRRSNNFPANFEAVSDTIMLRKILYARLAQLVEHETLNLRVVGSSPTLGDQFFLKFFLPVKRKPTYYRSDI